MDEMIHSSRVSNILLPLSAGIIDIAMCFILFNGQQYFSFTAMLSIVALFFSGLALLIAPAFMQSGSSMADVKIERLVLALLAVSVIAILYGLYFALQYSPGVLATLSGYILILVAAALSIASVYFACNALQSNRTRLSGNSIVILLLVASSIVAFYLSMSALKAMQWKGTDEIAFDYYASYLFFNGSNPYIANMKPVINQFGLDPTLRLNGSCECQYGYPALSFIPFTLLALFGVHSYYPFVFVSILCVSAAALMVYYNTGKKKRVLLLLALFVALAFMITPAGSVKYLAVSIFLLIAYLQIKKPKLNGTLLGLAAATHPLSWVALPFFYVLNLKLNGRSGAAVSILVSGAVFLLVNSYFLVLSPQAMIRNLFVFGGKLAFLGPTLMQMLVTFYAVPYWYLTVLVVLVYLTSIALFYLYNGTLRAVMAIVPGTLFFFSWVNDLVYFLAFVPLLILIYYEKTNSAKDMLNDKRPVGYITVAVVVLSLLLLVYAHLSYVSSNILQINSTEFVLNANHTAGIADLYGAKINVTNNGNTKEKLFFYILSRDPNAQNYVIGIPSFTLDPHGTYIFDCDFYIKGVSSSTRVYVYVLSDDYVQSAEFLLPYVPH